MSQLDERQIITKLSIIDRFLPVWIIIAMGIGLLLGQIEGISDVFNAVQFGSVSLPIAIGLLWMMYPVFAKVKYEQMNTVLKDKKMFTTSIFLNWVVGPLLMFVLAWIFLADYQGFREGVILIGLARCIAMVLIWNMLAGGNNEDAAVLVALNSVFQVFMFSVYAYFFLNVASGWFGGEETLILVSMGDIAFSVLIFLGLPMLAGYLTRKVGIKKMGRDEYDNKFAKKLGPTALIGLLYTIVIMFAIQGKNIVDLKWDILLVAIPLVLYFLLMFVLAYIISWLLKFSYMKTVTISFTAASNNFELAIAVAVGSYGINSNQALATVIGPLVEVPVLISLVYLSLWMKNIFFKENTGQIN